jgi:hypothetical protein
MLVVCTAGAVSAGGAQRIAEAAAAVSEEAIRRHTAALGSDAMEGRAPGTPGGLRAAAYIAGELERLGVRPLGDDGSFFQQVPTATFRARPLRLNGRRASRVGKDYLLSRPEPDLATPLPPVFVGYGSWRPSSTNDYADVDVRAR